MTILQTLTLQILWATFCKPLQGKSYELKTTFWNLFNSRFLLIFFILSNISKARIVYLYKFSHLALTVSISSVSCKRWFSVRHCKKIILGSQCYKIDLANRLYYKYIEKGLSIITLLQKIWIHLFRNNAIITLIKLLLIIYFT